MKKLFMLVAVVTLGFVSCSKDSDEDKAFKVEFKIADGIIFKTL